VRVKDNWRTWERDRHWDRTASREDASAGRDDHEKKHHKKNKKKKHHDDDDDNRGRGKHRLDD